MVSINPTFTEKVQNYHHQTSKHHKQNTINGDLYRRKRVSPNFDEEIPMIKREVYDS